VPEGWKLFLWGGGGGEEWHPQNIWELRMVNECGRAATANRHFHWWDLLCDFRAMNEWLESVPLDIKYWVCYSSGTHLLSKELFLNFIMAETAALRGEYHVIRFRPQDLRKEAGRCSG